MDQDANAQGPGPAAGPRLRAARKFGLYALVALLLLGAGYLLADWLNTGTVAQSVTRATARQYSPVEEITRQEVEWRPWASTAMHELEAASFRIAPFGSLGRGGAIEEVGGNIVVLSPMGELGYVTPDYEMRVLPLSVDLGMQALRDSGIAERTGFVSAHFRALDLLAIPRPGGELVDLYVSHHRFTGTCFEIVISRTALRVDDIGLRPAEPGFEDFYVTQPCLPPKTRGMVFEGNQTGGRMVVQDANHILFSVGDADFNGVYDDRIFSQDPSIDYGKILRVDMTTRTARIFAMGFRNPQGLVIRPDGEVWGTDHGPEGGDEINHIREGRNYGWPVATYGQEYRVGGPRRDWALNAAPASHAGYERPAIALVPSIGISNVIQPDAREFDRWGDYLLVGSLYSGHKLLVVHLDENRVASVEPINIDNVYRDLLSLRDGRIAILTDRGMLLFLRNAERSAALGRERRFVATATPEARGRVARGWDTAYWAESPGEDLYTRQCLTCHSMADVVGVGPPLNGVVGRRIGGSPDYGYSAALLNANQEWTQQRLREFLADPQARFPGTAMPKFELSQQEIEQLVTYLANPPEQDAAR
jgi:cytochrome c2